MRFVMLSLEHGHPFHSLTELSESSIGIHIQPVINNSHQDQLGFYGIVSQAVEEIRLSLMNNMKNGREKETNTGQACVNVCVMEYLCLYEFAFDVHMRGF